MEKPVDTRVRVQIRKSELFRRVRKAVWKEKDLDPVWVKQKQLDGSYEEVKRKTLYILHCELIKEDGILIFWVTPKTTHEDV